MIAINGWSGKMVERVELDYIRVIRGTGYTTE